jgi:glycosyltransferase involved in cell wall biosynthesis
LDNFHYYIGVYTLESADNAPTGLPIPSRNGIFRDVVVVIPAYNEELVIGSIVLKARRIVERVIVVDDGSPDRTAEVATYAGAIVLRLEKNMGKAHALMTGLNHARDLGCEAAVTLDGDGQHKTQEIPDVVTPILEGKADLVIGSRFLSKTNGVPRHRRLGQKVLDVFTRIGSKHSSTDSQSGFRAFSRTALDNLDFQSSNYNIESDMIAHFAERGLRILEVPTMVRYDVPNKHKKNPVAHGLGVLVRIINIISLRRPLLAFGIPGFILVVGGMIAALVVFTELYTTGTFHYILALGSAFVVMTGMLLGIAGLILHSLVYFVKNERKNI